MRFAIVILLFVAELAAAQTPYGLLQSSDGGMSWSEATQGFASNRVNHLGQGKGQFFAATDRGFYIADDPSAWRQIGPTNRLLTVAVSGDDVVAGGPQGVWISNDAAKSWQLSTNVHALSSFAANGRIWLGSNEGAVYLSDDGGTHWVSKSDGLPDRAQIFDLSVAPNGRVFAGLYSKGFWEFDGERWRRLGSMVAPLAIFSANDVLLGGHNPGGIYRSSDDGKTWSHILNGIHGDVPTWTLFGHRGAIFYGTSSESGLYRSTDRGITWTPMVPVRDYAVVAMTASENQLLAAFVKRNETINFVPDILKP